eukprot:189037_1
MWEGETSQKTSDGVEEDRNGGRGEVDDSSTIPSFEWAEKETRARQRMNEILDHELKELQSIEKNIDYFVAMRRILLSELDRLESDRATLCSVEKGESSPDGTGVSPSTCPETPAIPHLRTVSLEPVYVPTIPRPPVPENSLPPYARQLQQLLLEMSSDDDDGE